MNVHRFGCLRGSGIFEAPVINTWACRFLWRVACTELGSAEQPLPPRRPPVPPSRSGPAGLAWAQDSPSLGRAGLGSC